MDGWAAGLLAGRLGGVTLGDAFDGMLLWLSQFHFLQGARTHQTHTIHCADVDSDEDEVGGGTPGLTVLHQRARNNTNNLIIPHDFPFMATMAA